MPQWTNFAGRYTELLDGNLTDFTRTEATTTLVIGTADSGPSEFLWSVTDRMQAVNMYGTGGTLIQGMYEALEGGAPAVVLWRIGGTTASLAGIGGTITITPSESSVSAGTEFSASWVDKMLYIWRISDGTQVYELDWTGSSPIVNLDLNGEVGVTWTGTPSEDPEFGTDELGIALDELDSAASSGITGLTYTAGTAGTDMTKKELYVALNEAYKLLEDQNLHFIVPMEVYLDDLNVADDATLAGGTEDYLGYLNIEPDADGIDVYTWSDTQLTDYHEVNFAYQLANFCHWMTVNELMVHGCIGTLGPETLSIRDVSTWVGKLPSYSATDSTAIISNGTGLLGNKFMAGTTSWDPGFWAVGEDDNGNHWLDSLDVLQDRNGVDVDMGKHLSVVSDYWRLTNRYSAMVNTRQVSSIENGAATYCGFIASLSPTQAPSYKMIPATIKIPYSIGKTKRDSLAGAHYIVLRPTATGDRIADGPTAARETSDYRRFSTFNIVKYCDRLIRGIQEEFVGTGMDLYKRSALKGKLDNRFKDVVADGILQRPPIFKIEATAFQAVNGDLYVYSELVPSFETRRIFNVTSLKPQ